MGPSPFGCGTISENRLLLKQYFAAIDFQPYVALRNAICRYASARNTRFMVACFFSFWTSKPKTVSAGEFEQFLQRSLLKGDGNEAIKTRWQNVRADFADTQLDAATVVDMVGQESLPMNVFSTL